MKTKETKAKAAVALQNLGWSVHDIAIALQSQPRTITRYINNLSVLDTNINTGPPPTLMQVQVSDDPSSNLPISPNASKPTSLSIAAEGGRLSENACSVVKTPVSAGKVHEAHLSLLKDLRRQVTVLVGRLKSVPFPADKSQAAADLVERVVRAAERLIVLERRIVGLDGADPGAGVRTLLAIVKVDGIGWESIARAHTEGRIVAVEPDDKT